MCTIFNKTQTPRIVVHFFSWKRHAAHRCSVIMYLFSCFSVSQERRLGVKQKSIYSTYMDSIYESTEHSKQASRICLLILSRFWREDGECSHLSWVSHVGYRLFHNFKTLAVVVMRYKNDFMFIWGWSNPVHRGSTHLRILCTPTHFPRVLWSSMPNE